MLSIGCNTLIPMAKVCVKSAGTLLKWVTVVGLFVYLSVITPKDNVIVVFLLVIVIVFVVVVHTEYTKSQRFTCRCQSKCQYYVIAKTNCSLPLNI